MDVLTFETCWALNNEIIKRVTSSWSVFIQAYVRCVYCVLRGRLPGVLVYIVAKHVVKTFHKLWRTVTSLLDVEMSLSTTDGEGIC